MPFEIKPATRQARRSAKLTPVINIGDRFDRLVAIGSREKVGKYVKVLCRCDCGTVRHITEYNLKSGQSRSCGCLNDEAIKKAVESRTIHGESRRTSGKTPKWQTWCRIRQRCSNPNDPNYNRYGGRGIKVCPQWIDSYENFLSDMGRRPIGHSIERINNDGDYCPGNCRWATRVEQCNNRSSSRWVEFRGDRKTIAQWAKAFGLNQTTLGRRIISGWSAEAALTQPVRRSA